MPTLEALSQEIADIHRFFEAWLGGRRPNDPHVFERELVGRFDPGFVMVTPDGQLLEAPELWPMLQDAWSSSPELRIQVRAVRRHPPAAGELAVVTYEEWQRNARNAPRADNGRRTTAVLVEDPERPNGLRWLHAHEGWLPAAVVEADPFDF